MGASQNPQKWNRGSSVPPAPTPRLQCPLEFQDSS